MIRSLVQKVDTFYAVLDLHFSPNNPELVAVATSIGTICLFQVEIVESDVLGLKEVSTIPIAATSTLVLSLAWSPSTSEPGWIAASLSDGNIVILDCEDWQSSKFQKRCHTLEVWTLAFLPSFSRQPLLFSGGDDSVLCANWVEWLHQGCSADPSRLRGSFDNHRYLPDRKTHGAGVTAILPLVVTADPEDQIVVTGSYDEYIRVLAAPKSPGSNRWSLLAEKQLYGGVWRLKLVRSQLSQGCGTFTVVASCMHAGVQIITISKSKDTGWTISTIAKFEEHESMNYASDARPEPGESVSRKFTVVSTSFYDKKLCMWQFNSM